MRQDAAAETLIRAAKPDDLTTVVGLLEAMQLPTVEVDRWLDNFFIAEVDGAAVGCAGLELHGPAGILRSVAVDEAHRGHGIGAFLTDVAVEAARTKGIRELYLLTTTAEAFFPRHGFREIPRAEASEDAQRSIEFREACPASATVMVRELT